MIGDYNVSNLLGVIAAQRALGVPLAQAVAACAQLAPVPGRMERLVAPGQPLVAVDYAHTPMRWTRHCRRCVRWRWRGGRLWCVFGCGGDRDASKRPPWALWRSTRPMPWWSPATTRAARSPGHILHQILLGTIAGETVRAEPDRAAAIAQVLAEADARDVVLIAGKGPRGIPGDGGRAPAVLRHGAGTCRAGTPGSLRMAMMTLQQAFAWIHAREPRACLVGEGATPLARVHTDTRTLQPGDLFVALRGERFDAHQFLAQARAAGCRGRLAERGLQEAGLPGIAVPDSLQAWARWRRAGARSSRAATDRRDRKQRQDHGHANAGGHSAGARAGSSVLDPGQPEQCHRRPADSAAPDGAAPGGRGELGMNHPGEIAELARIAQPTVALVNNAQREHLEFMHTVQAVAEENGAVLAALPASGVAVFPAGDAYTPLWQALANGRRCLTFGGAVPTRCTGADWMDGAWRVEIATPQGALHCTLHIAGRHNVDNALAATACALAAGCRCPTLRADYRPLCRSRAGHGRSACPALAGPSRWWTTATTPTPTPCARPSTCWRRCLHRACWCWETWARWATRGRSSMPRPGRRRRPAVSNRLFALGRQSAHAAAAFWQCAAFRQHGIAAGSGARGLPGGAVLVKGSRFREDGTGGGGRGRRRAGEHDGRRQRAPQHERRCAMLMWLAQWLQGLSPDLGFLRVFQYLTLRAVLGAMTALLIGLFAGPRDPAPDRAQDRPAHPYQRHGNAPCQERHTHHGRVLILLAIAISTLLWADLSNRFVGSCSSSPSGLAASAGRTTGARWSTKTPTACARARNTCGSPSSGCSRRWRWCSAFPRAQPQGVRAVCELGELGLFGRSAAAGRAVAPSSRKSATRWAYWVSSS